MAGVYEAPAFFLTTNLPNVCNLTPQRSRLQCNTRFPHFMD